jgi:hypothetical protein
MALTRQNASRHVLEVKGFAGSDPAVPTGSRVFSKIFTPRQSQRKSHSPSKRPSPEARASEAGQSRGQGSLSHLGAARQPRQLQTDRTPTPAHRPRAASSMDVAGPGHSTKPAPASCSNRPGTIRPRPPATSRPDAVRRPGRPARPGLRPRRPGPHAAGDRGLPSGHRSHQRAMALFSDRGNRLGHAEALTRLGGLSPGRRPTKQAHRTAAIPGTGQRPCRHSERRANRPPGHAGRRLSGRAQLA